MSLQTCMHSGSLKFFIIPSLKGILGSNDEWRLGQLGGSGTLGSTSFSVKQRLKNKQKTKNKNKRRHFVANFISYLKAAVGGCVVREDRAGLGLFLFSPSAISSSASFFHSSAASGGQTERRDAAITPEGGGGMWGRRGVGFGSTATEP